MAIMPCLLGLSRNAKHEAVQHHGVDTKLSPENCGDFRLVVGRTVVVDTDVSPFVFVIDGAASNTQAIASKLFVELFLLFCCEYKDVRHKGNPLSK